jgi:hypothetical protein
MTGTALCKLNRLVYGFPQQFIICGTVRCMTAGTFSPVNRIAPVGPVKLRSIIVMTCLAKFNFVFYKVIFKLRTMWVMTGKAPVIKGFVPFAPIKSGFFMTGKT